MSLSPLTELISGRPWGPPRPCLVKSPADSVRLSLGRRGFERRAVNVLEGSWLWLVTDPRAGAPVNEWGFFFTLYFILTPGASGVCSTSRALCHVRCVCGRPVSWTCGRRHR